MQAVKAQTSLCECETLPELSLLGTYMNADAKLDSLFPLDSYACMFNNAELKLRVGNENLCSYFSTKTYVVGTQKNRLNETVLLSTQSLC